MDFLRYYRALARRNPAHVPHADEARRDFQDALQRAVDGMLFVR
jgi:hypothetical protein